MDFLKDWRILLLLSLLMLSIIVISPWPKQGIVVKGIGDNSDLKGIVMPNDIIYSINGNPATIENANNISGYVLLSTNHGKVNATVNNSQLFVQSVPSNNLKFGLDVEGGLLAVVEPVSNVSDDVLTDIKSTLEKRMSSLRESSFQIIKYQGKSYIQVQIAGGNEADLRKIINTTGIFEAKIPIPVEFKNSSGILKFGEHSDWIAVNYLGNNSISLFGSEYKTGDVFYYKNVSFEIWNITKDRAEIAATAYRNDGSRKDIAKVYVDAKNSFVQQTSSGYMWQFNVEVTPSASENFYNSIRNLRVLQTPGQDSYLESKIYLYLDNKSVSNLSIGATLAKKPTTSATVSGGAKTADEAKEEKRWLQDVLRSGALPTELEILSTKTISPKLGESFVFYTMLAFAAAIATVSAIIFIRYKNIKIASFVILTCISEVIIILGSSVMIGWTLDLAAIAGIIAVIGTGVDQQIMIIDEILMGEKTWTMKSKIKRALFIVFGSAGTVLAAMLPLMLLGFGMLRGFAITTSLGVLIAIFITRPAFTVLVERTMNKEHLL